MKELFICNILTLLLLLNSCSVIKPKHKIYGKWQTTNSQKAIFTFDETNTLKTELFGHNHIYKGIADFQIIDEKSAIFTQFANDPNEKITYTIKLISDNEFQIGCEFKTVINGVTRVDAPEFCVLSSFKKIEDIPLN